MQLRRRPTATSGPSNKKWYFQRSHVLLMAMTLLVIFVARHESISTADFLDQAQRERTKQEHSNIVKFSKKSQRLIQKLRLKQVRKDKGFHLCRLRAPDSNKKRNLSLEQGQEPVEIPLEESPLPIAFQCAGGPYDTFGQQLEALLKDKVFLKQKKKTWGRRNMPIPARTQDVGDGEGMMTQGRINILFFGGASLRQVVTALLCQYSHLVVSMEKLYKTSLESFACHITLQQNIHLYVAINPPFVYSHLHWQSMLEHYVLDMALKKMDLIVLSKFQTYTPEYGHNLLEFLGDHEGHDAEQSLIVATDPPDLLDLIDVYEGPIVYVSLFAPVGRSMFKQIRAQMDDIWAGRDPAPADMEKRDQHPQLMQLHPHHHHQQSFADPFSSAASQMFTTEARAPRVSSSKKRQGFWGRRHARFLMRLATKINVNNDAMEKELPPSTNDHEPRSIVHNKINNLKPRRLEEEDEEDDEDDDEEGPGNDSQDGEEDDDGADENPTYQDEEDTDGMEAEENQDSADGDEPNNMVADEENDQQQNDSTEEENDESVESGDIEQQDIEQQDDTGEDDAAQPQVQRESQEEDDEEEGSNGEILPNQDASEGNGATSYDPDEEDQNDSVHGDSYDDKGSERESTEEEPDSVENEEDLEEEEDREESEEEEFEEEEEEESIDHDAPLIVTAPPRPSHKPITKRRTNLKAIDARQYVDKLGECTSDISSQIGTCLTDKSNKSYQGGHRCFGEHGGHADLVAWDVIEEIHTLLNKERQRSFFGRHGK